MAKRVSVELDDDLYLELVHRGGGPRKVSAPANALIRAGLEAERASSTDPAAALMQEVARLASEVAHLVAAVTAQSGPRAPGGSAIS
jgi:hypothetical protein